MSMELQRAIAAGVIVKTQGGCRCEVCDRDVPEIEPHLRGKDHFNNLAWEALRNPAPHPFLLDVIPPVVREAKDRKELELEDKAFFSYKCLVCPKKSLSNGIKSLETHLKGKDHEKAKKMMPPPVLQTHPTSVPQPQFPPSSQPTGIKNTPLLVVPQNPDPQPYQLPGSQPSSHLQSWYPQTDHFQNLYPSGNPQPSPQQTPVSQPLTQPSMSTYNPPPQPPASTLPHTSATGASWPNPPMAMPIPQPSPPPRGEAAGATGPDPEVERALNEGIVERGGDGHAFTCRVCEKNVNGPAPCLEHLRSEKHKRKAQTRMQQPPSGTGRPQQGTDGLFERVFESLSISTGRREQVNGSWEFPWQVVTQTQPILPTDRIYSNCSMPRGLVLIFNYCFTGKGEHERCGAKRDSFNLKTLFHRMGYLVYLYEDLSRSQTEEALTRNQNDPYLRKYDSFIVFILSHGKDDQTFFTASCLEEDCLKLDDVRYRFTDIECPALKDKPKLFFANFCRGNNLEPQTAYDGISPQRQSPKDMITLYSCINTFKAPRHPERGTYFVQAWCQVLATHAYNEELRDLHQFACQVMLDMDASTPELQEYYFKKFYFNPVYTSY